MRNLLSIEGIDSVLRRVVILLVLMILLLEIHHVILLGRDMVELEGWKTAKTIKLLGLLDSWSNKFIILIAVLSLSPKCRARMSIGLNGALLLSPYQIRIA